MLTIAIQNSTRSGKQAIEVIKKLASEQELSVKRIAPVNSIVYIKNKRLSLRQYIEKIRCSKVVDVLVVELTKEGVKRQIYQNIDLEMTLILIDTHEYYSVLRERERQRCNPLKKIRSERYIVPDVYKYKKEKYVTYGWSGYADIVATSVQMEVKGQAHLQCSVQVPMTSIRGHLINSFEEFSLKSNLTNQEGMLAGMAAMILYGIEQ